MVHKRDITSAALAIHLIRLGVYDVVKFNLFFLPRSTNI